MRFLTYLAALAAAAPVAFSAPVAAGVELRDSDKTGPYPHRGPHWSPHPPPPQQPKKPCKTSTTTSESTSTKKCTKSTSSTHAVTTTLVTKCTTTPKPTSTTTSSTKCTTTPKSTSTTTLVTKCSTTSKSTSTSTTSYHSSIVTPELTPTSLIPAASSTTTTTTSSTPAPTCQVVVNPSFEMGNTSPASDNMPPPWVYDMSFVTTNDTAAYAEDGAYFAVLPFDSVLGGATLSQTVTGLIPGDNYVFSFYKNVPVYSDPAPIDGSGSSVELVLVVRIGTVSQTYVIAPAVDDDYLHYSFIYNATTTAETITFLLVNEGDGGNDVGSDTATIHVGLDLITLTNRSPACEAAAATATPSKKETAKNPLLLKKEPALPVTRVGRFE